MRKKRLFAEQVEKFQTEAICHAQQKSCTPGAIPREADLFPLDSAKAKGNPPKEEKVRRGADLQEVMVARNVDGSDQNKFYNRQQSTAAPIPFMHICQFHFCFATAPARAIRRVA